MPFFVDGSNAACPAAGINPGPANNGYSSSKHRFCFSVSGRTETVRTNISPQKYNNKLLQQRKKWYCRNGSAPDGRWEFDAYRFKPDTERRLCFPLPGAKVISPYAGRRKHHSGVDLKTCANDTIISAFDGIVRLAKPYYAYGNVIVVRHYNGLETVYSHNSKNLVKPGDYVKAGQPIALTGRTGRATTEHLHFEVRVNGQHFNPNLVFDLQERKLNNQCLVFTQKVAKLQWSPSN